MPPYASSSRSVDRWIPPPQNELKVNVDAHILEVFRVCFWVVMRDRLGCLRMAAVKRVEAMWETEMAEAKAARYGLELATRFGFDRVVLESDAANVVRTVHMQ